MKKMVLTFGLMWGAVSAAVIMAHVAEHAKAPGASQQKIEETERQAKNAKRRLMKRVTGIGGVFFKSENPQQLYEWYEKHLGIQREPHGQGASFHWRELQAADGSEPGPKAQTAWSIFPRTTKYFGASKASFMINYRVDNLDALLEDLKESGVEIDPHREDADYGRFAWITDPDGNRIELWEPPKPKKE